jgi:MFS family permease
VEDTAAREGVDRWLMWFAGGALFVCYLGQTTLGVIQPTIDSELGLSASEAQWVVNSFFLTLALFAAPGGRLGDYYGHRRVLLVALAVFAVGSLSAAVSDGFLWLVASLAVAGAGASTLYPSSAALVANAVRLEIRGRALGQYSAIGVSVFIVGPLAAGLLTEVASWRLMFALQVVLAVALALVGWRYVSEHPAGAPRPFDAGGLAVLMIGLTASLVALMQALTWGWDSPATILLLLAGVGVLVGFGAMEWGRPDPLLDTRLLGRRAFRGIAIAMFTAQFILNGFTIYIATYFQHILGYGALLASVAMLPAFAGAPYYALLSGRITDQLGARRPGIFGYGLAIAAFVWLAIFVDSDSYWALVPGLVALGIAIAPMFTTLLTALSNAVGPEERGDANALVLTIRWIGAAAGTMVLGVVIHATERGGVPTSGGYSAAFLVSAAVVAVGLLACVFLMRGPESERKPAHHRHHFRPHL